MNKWLGGCLLAGFSAVTCAQHPDGAAQLLPVAATPVKVLELKQNGADQAPVFAGRVEAGESAVLAFRVSGLIRDLRVTMGQRVTKGTVLAELDPTDYALNLEAREAEFELARLGAARAESLFRRQLISEDKFDTARTRLATTRARLEQAREQLSYCKLTAPFEGSIPFTYAMPSEVVAAQQPVLTLQDTSRLEIHLNLPARYQPLLANAVPALFKVELDLQPGILHEATLKEVSPQAERDTNSYPITLLVREPSDFTLRPGMSVSARLYHPSLQVGRWLLPREALFERSGQSAQVWRIDTATRAIHKTTVTLDDSGYLLSGLNPGDRIVAAGVTGLTEGQQVRPWVREGGL